MTQDQFAMLCEEYLIDPAVALENESIVEALEAGDDVEVRRLLQEEF